MHDIREVHRQISLSPFSVSPRSLSFFLSLLLPVFFPRYCLLSLPLFVTDLQLSWTEAADRLDARERPTSGEQLKDFAVSSLSRAPSLVPTNDRSLPHSARPTGPRSPTWSRLARYTAHPDYLVALASARGLLEMETARGTAHARNGASYVCWSVRGPLSPPLLAPVSLPRLTFASLFNGDAFHPHRVSRLSFSSYLLPIFLLLFFYSPSEHCLYGSRFIRCPGYGPISFVFRFSLLFFFFFCGERANTTESAQQSSFSNSRGAAATSKLPFSTMNDFSWETQNQSSLLLK